MASAPGYERFNAALRKVSLTAFSSQANAVQPGRVAVNNLLLDRGGNFREIPLHHLARMRPGAVAVGKIRRPHVAILAEELVSGGSHGIVLESRPQLAARVFAGLERQARIRHRPEFFKGMVEAVEEVRQPSGV